MKKVLPLIFIIFTSLFTTSCGDGEGTEIVGRIHGFEYLGFTCWFIKDESTGFQYEIVSQDELLLKENNKVRIKLTPSKTQTICKVGDKMSVIGYRLLK